MKFLPPIDFKKWIEKNRHLLKPPVGNKVLYDKGDFIIMVVGGPNSRKDYHVDPIEEFFYQIKGDMILKIIDNGNRKNIIIKEGEVFLLPKNIPHSPQRLKDTVGLVVEYKREKGLLDTFQWYCEACDDVLYEVNIQLEDIVTQLPPLFDSFWKNEQNRTCGSCGVIQLPIS